MVIIALFLLLQKLKVLFLKVSIVLTGCSEPVFKKLGFSIGETLFSRCRLWRTASFIIFNIILSFLPIAWGLPITLRLLKPWMGKLLISAASMLIFVTVFSTWICFLKAVLVSFYSCVAIVTKYFRLLNWSWTYQVLITFLIFLMDFLNLSQSVIHLPSYLNYRWADQRKHLLICWSILSAWVINVF